MSCELCGFTGEPVVIWDKNERDKKGILYSKVIRDENGNMVNAVNVICPVCGLVYTVPKTDRCKDFYKKEYREEYGFDIEAESNHAHNAFDVLYSRKFLCVPFLDVGASTGELVNIVRKLSKDKSNAVGIDASHENESVTKVDLMDYNPDMKFRCVTMLNTLEHMYSPVEALNKVYDLTDEKAVLLVSVPDLLNTCINKTMDAFLSNAHLYNFTADSLFPLLVKCGFRPVDITIIPEEIGFKLYAVALKDKPKEPKYKKPNIDLIKRLLIIANDLFLTKYTIMEGDAK